MSNDEHVALLKQGVAAWNRWRDKNPNIRPDLAMADLRHLNLRRAKLREAKLRQADLREANFVQADFSGADLSRANCVQTDLSGANLVQADLIQTDLRKAKLADADLREADLGKADLREANLYRANLIGTNLHRADLRGGRLSGAQFIGARLTKAKLIGANLQTATLVSTDITGADLTGCRIYGLSAWGVKIGSTKQHNLVITPASVPEITVDNIEVAQFIYLMLNNQKIREVIDTLTSKAVLILGRFTDKRKAVLDALREELRKRNYLPILFDFSVPATRDITDTVSLLARIARFIIADLTDPSSIPKELEAIVPHLAVPVQPLLKKGASRSYEMFKDYWKYEWVLPVYPYKGLKSLLARLAEEVIAPAERKANDLQKRRRRIEAELTKPAVATAKSRKMLRSQPSLRGRGQRVRPRSAFAVIAPAEGKVKALEERRRIIEAELTKPQ
jgi:uncharacterized protein YjbI with pentapeptide repeats